MANQTLQVKGMGGHHCVLVIEGVLNKLGAAGKVDLASHTVDVSYDENRIDIEDVKEAIEEQGYDVV
ncbi:cation transporter [Cohnella soli]|uniref:Cation transporter n=1 Tax=Cohnella soli TaxID=425005 RepID=A0ABW0HQM7_9BACL